MCHTCFVLFMFTFNLPFLPISKYYLEFAKYMYIHYEQSNWFTVSYSFNISNDSNWITRPCMLYCIREANRNTYSFFPVTCVCDFVSRTFIESIDSATIISYRRKLWLRRKVKRTKIVKSKWPAYQVEKLDSNYIKLPMGSTALQYEESRS